MHIEERITNNRTDKSSNKTTTSMCTPWLSPNSAWL